MTRGLCVVLAPPGTSAERLALAIAALGRRGVELFAERVWEAAGETAALVGDAQPGNIVLICFEPLIAAQDPTGEAFDHPAIDSAAFHLGATLGPAADGIKIATTARQAEAIPHAVLSAAECSLLRERIALRRAQMETSEPVLAVLSRHRHRAKVELVRWEGREAVKKTFRATSGKAMANEIAFHDDIAPLSPVPAGILHRTDTALYFEYIAQRPTRSGAFNLPLVQLLTLKSLAQLADFARLVTARGWDPLDLTPRDNVLIAAQTGDLRCIDFEFARRAPTPLKPEAAAFLAGLRNDDAEAALFDVGMRQDPYPGKWRPFTGLSRDSFLHDPAWLQRVKRTVVHPVWLGWRALGVPQRRRAHLRRRAALLRALALEVNPC
ncbi:hypothetical protein SAMN04488523_11567 [Sulfitobacter brevis]|uniref:Uncharacterized protein n=1 Tax=Sulfitobacter brevis TaxID=74348 RepID=A0A1I2FD96_9RHOB|nr:hypothetical protein [Sulfitobacter brevis]SFF03205.1 hypothetical protein SAMN04488523_11567 [Sulfitobacter brevis]